jgi:hypothetical protein
LNKRGGQRKGCASRETVGPERQRQPQADEQNADVLHR